MKAEIFSIERTGPGRLSTMARPRGGEWPRDEVEALQAAGSDVIVSLLTTPEAAELELQSEADVVKARGMKFLTLPTPDRGTPDASDFRALLDVMKAALRANKHVVVHCRMGIGRSSLVAAGLLITEGVPYEAAWAAVARARGLDVPDTSEQKSWLETVMTGAAPRDQRVWPY